MLHVTPRESGAHAKILTVTHRVDGGDLLAYRHAGDALAVIRAVVRRSSEPVIVARSIDRDDGIVAVRASGLWGLALGFAIFDQAFVPGAGHLAQIEHVFRAAAAGEYRACRRTSSVGTMPPDI